MNIDNKDTKKEAGTRCNTCADVRSVAAGVHGKSLDPGKNAREREEGMALVTATMFMSVALIALSALTMRVVNQGRQVDMYLGYENCMYGINNAQALSISLIEDGACGNVGITDMSDGQTEFPTFDSSFVTPLKAPGMPDTEYFALDIVWGNDGIDNNGDGTIDGPEEQGYHTVYAFARDHGQVRVVEVVVVGKDVNVWNNAIFAGGGASGGCINGNVSIHGSVHILGDNIPEGGDAVAVIELSGASLIHNNYGAGSGPGPSLETHMQLSVPPLSVTTVNGEADQKTLNAELRVKRGLVSLNGSSEVGNPDQFGNAMKDLMDNTFNTDGWSGNKTTSDGDRGDPSVVHSDNGWDELYDLSDKVPFPVLEDDWQWPANVQCTDFGYEYPAEAGAKEAAPDGSMYTYEDYFSNVLSDGDPYTGTVTVNTSIPVTFYYNSTRGGLPVNRVKDDPSMCTKGDDYLYFNKDTGVLEINGQVEINGNVALTGKADLYYTGRGSVLVRGNVSVDCCMYTCNNGNTADYANSFPAQNCMGIMATNNIYFGAGNGASQLRVLGAFYAVNKIQSKKQTAVMGTFVSTVFDMGSQVPDIFQVPALAQCLPLGMIGAAPIMAISQVSWRELNLASLSE